MVDLVEAAPLTLSDRRIYNRLLDHAWDALDRPVTHVIAKTELAGDQVDAAIERLMAAVIRVSVMRRGEPATERVQLLGGTVGAAPADGFLEYEIPPRLRRILRNSAVFARLQREVMFALNSKYALALYEQVQARGTQRVRDSERLSLVQLRIALGVPAGRLTTWSNLRLRAIAPAVEEVNRLSDFMVEIAPVKTGRSVTHVDLRWRAKDREGQGVAARAPGFSRIGRKPRGAGQAETVVAASRPALSPETYRTARTRYPECDLRAAETAWRAGGAKGTVPDDHPDRAFLSFLRNYAGGGQL